MKKNIFLIIVAALFFAGCKQPDVINNYYYNTPENGNIGSSGSAGNASGAVSVYPGVDDCDPRPGKIYYSDGSVSEFYDKTKTPVGIVVNLTDEGKVKYIVGLKDSEIPVDYKVAQTFTGEYDANCDFAKGKWKLPTNKTGMLIGNVSDLINKGITNVVVAGFTGNIAKLKNTNYHTSTQSDSSTYMICFNPIIGGYYVTSGIKLALAVLDVSALSN